MRCRPVVPILAAVLLLSGCAADPLPTTGRPVGPVPWSDAVAASSASRVLALTADVSGVIDRMGCAPTTSARVTETATAVHVLVTVVAHPLPPGVACAAVRVTGLSFRVHLHAPLGTRRLVDDDRHLRRAVLLVDRTPAVHDVPAGFTRQVTSWNESTGVVGEWWRRFRRPAQFNRDFGPVGAPTSILSIPANARHIAIGRGEGMEWTQRIAADTVSHDIVWRSGSVRYHLSVIDQSGRPLTADDAAAIARSIR